MKDWSYLYAFVQGKGHLEENSPCQDYCNVFQHENYTICVVSDGAGSCENSHIGSRNATLSAGRHFSVLIEAQNWHKSIEVPLEEWHKIALKGFKAIRDDLETISIQGYELKSLSCTLIVTIQLKNKLLVTHIGDGRAGYCNLKDEWNAMITPYKGSYSNETVFITSDIWQDETVLNKYIESRIIEEKIKAFCLLTDGCENAAFECYKMDHEAQIPIDVNRPFKDFFHENVNVHIPNLVKAQKNQHEIDLNKIWESFLMNGNDTLKNENDDKTMILAVKTS